MRGFRTILLVLMLVVIGAIAALPASAALVAEVEEVGIDGCTLTVAGTSYLDTTYLIEVYTSESSPTLVGSAIFTGVGAFQEDFDLEPPFDDGVDGFDVILYSLFKDEFSPIDYDFVSGVPTVDDCDGSSAGAPEIFDPGDARINRQPYATFTVVCFASTIVVYPIDLVTGEAGIPIETQEPDGLPSDDLPIGFGSGIQVFQLPSGEILVIGAPGSDGKIYSIIFDGCPATYVDAFMTFPDGTRVMTEHDEL